jgi:16S rRNA (adenine1518-N6/adenine1519-N6)-dimethyltransferase
MMAEPGTPEWSSFSVLCRFACTVTDGGDLQPGSFYPAPRVRSKTVVLSAHRRYPSGLAPEVSRAARELFSARRKTIRNALKGGGLVRQYGRERVFSALREAGIDPGVRGETLPVEAVVEFVRLLERPEE